jgi:hypothetical protein
MIFLINQPKLVLIYLMDIFVIAILCTTFSRSNLITTRHFLLKRMLYLINLFLDLIVIKTIIKV